MLLCTGLMTTSSSMLRSSASTALLGLSRDSWERDSFTLGIRWDLGGGQQVHQAGAVTPLPCPVPSPPGSLPRPPPATPVEGNHSVINSQVLFL